MNTSDSSISYCQHIVAFIDILGFSSLVKNSINDNEQLEQISFALEEFSQLRLKETWRKAEILIEVEEDAQKKGLDDYYVDSMARCYCLSDSVIITINAEEKIDERFSALVTMMSKIGAELLGRGILIRGAISIGKMYVDPNRNSIKVFGPALIEAYELERDEARLPRIILSENAIKKLTYPLYSKSKRQPYHQYIDRYPDGCTGFDQLIFLQVMNNTEDVISQKDWRILRDNIKNSIIQGLDTHFCNSHVYNKYAWLRERFNSLYLLEGSSQIIDVSVSESRHNIHYSYVNNVFEKGY